MFIVVYKNYIVYHNVYSYCCGVFIEKYVYAKFLLVVVSVCYMAIYVPIVTYGLRLFIVVLQELQCLQCCLHVDIIRVIELHQVLFVYTFRFLR